MLGFECEGWGWWHGNRHPLPCMRWWDEALARRRRLQLRACVDQTVLNLHMFLCHFAKCWICNNLVAITIILHKTNAIKCISLDSNTRIEQEFVLSRIKPLQVMQNEENKEQKQIVGKDYMWTLHLLLISSRTWITVSLYRHRHRHKHRRWLHK